MNRKYPLPLSLLMGIYIIGLPFSAMSASSKVEIANYSANGVDDVVFPTAKQACDDWVKKKIEGGSPSSKAPEHTDGIGYRCFWKDADGSDQDMENVYHHCPANSRADGDECVCESHYVSNGKTCVSSEEGTNEATASASVEQAGKSGSNDSNNPKKQEENDADRMQRICKDLTATLAATIGEANDLSGKTRKKDSNIELPPSRTSKATIALGTIVTPSGSESMVGGASSIREDEPRSSKYDNYARGIRADEDSNVIFGSGSLPACVPARKFEYPSNTARPVEGHAESKIIEDWFRGNPSNSVLYLKIGASQTSPCTDCDALIEFVNQSAHEKGCPRVEVCP